MKDRIEYFDFLRGIAIIGVIAIHTYGNLSDNLAVFGRQILNSSVPIFLAISGYLFANKDVSSNDKYMDFLKKQVPRVYLPMLFWSVPYLLLSILSHQNIFISVGCFFSGGYSVYYFIALILQFYILLPVFQKIATKKGVTVSLFITLGAMAVLFYINYMKEYDFPLIIYAAPFPVWLVFFIVGLFIGKKDSSFKPNIPIYGTLVIIGLLLSFAETMYISHMRGFITGVGIKSSATIYSFGIVLLMFSLLSQFRNNRFTHFISYIGKFSFGIYLSHMFIILCIGKLYPNFFEQIWIFKVFIILCISYIGCSFVYKVHPDLSRRCLGIG